MICPNCLVQMNQKDKLGGGVSEDNYYETHTIQECPICGRIVLEYYEAIVIQTTKDLLSVQEVIADNQFLQAWRQRKWTQK